HRIRRCGPHRHSRRARSTMLSGPAQHLMSGGAFEIVEKIKSLPDFNDRTRMPRLKVKANRNQFWVGVIDDGDGKRRQWPLATEHSCEYDSAGCFALAHGGARSTISSASLTTCRSPAGIARNRRC